MQTQHTQIPVSVDQPAFMLDVCFVLFLFCLSTSVCVCLQVQGPMRECPWGGAVKKTTSQNLWARINSK